VRFLNIYESYKKAPEITKKRLYLEKMAEVLRDNQIFIFDENIKNVNPFMGLEEIRGKGGEK
jgi:membrane protease subunit HflK